MVRGEAADIDGDGTRETFVGEPIRRPTGDSRMLIQEDARGSSRLMMDSNEDGRIDFVEVRAVGPPSAQMELSDANLDGCFESREISIYSMDGLMLYRATDADTDCDGVFKRVEEWTTSATME